MKNKLILIMSIITFASCKSSQNLPTVEKVDINKYAGKWYEIARLPNRFEKNLECVSATYTPKEKGKIEVLNKGYLIDKENEFKEIKGSAWVPDPNYEGRLKVRFFWPFAGDYYIIALDENYQYALVGDPSRKYLWILSKSKVLDENIYSDLLKVAKENGFATEELIKVKQDCD